MTIRSAFVSAVFAIGLVLLLAPHAGGADATAPVVVPLPEGILAISLSPRWETNPRLAQDNGVPLFIHPRGAKEGERLPTWLLVDRRTRPRGDSLDDAISRILREGTQFGFTVHESSEVETADGRPLRLFRFRPGEDGEERGMGLIETPGAILIFRYESVDVPTWNMQWASIDSMLQSTTLAVRDRR